MNLPLRWLTFTLISFMALYGCTVYQKPRPIHDVHFMERSQSKVDGDVRVTVAVLSAEESRQLGRPLPTKLIRISTSNKSRFDSIILGKIK